MQPETQTERDVQLRRLTTLGLGGTPQRYYRPASVPELRRCIRDCERAGRPWRVLGGGSNLLVDDGELPYAVVHIAAPVFDWITPTEGDKLRVGAGVRTARLLTFCRDNGLGGLEFLAGLPGTVGGAVAGNAGAWGCQICQPLCRVLLLRRDGQHVQLTPDRLDFGYRWSGLEQAVVTEVEFGLEPRDSKLIAAQMAEHAAARAERHPAGIASAGCIFKNPPGDSAGRLLDECGMKGVRVGDAEVSGMHANFILNRGSATAADVLTLVGRMRRAVRERFGIELELEVRHWASRTRVA